MSLLSLPQYPTTNEIASSGGIFYQWTGSKWKRIDTQTTSDFVEYTDVGVYSGNTVVLDTKRYNYHKITMSGNTTISASNVAMYSSAIVEVDRPYDATGAFNIQTASYDNKSFSAAAQISTAIFGLFFKPDGTKMYALGGAAVSYGIFQYTLSTPWDISTAIYDNISTAPGGGSAMYAFTFKPDGTKLYMINASSNTIISYPLSTAWNLLTVGAADFTLSISGQGLLQNSLFFKPDGTSMYITGGSNAAQQYNLTTPWQVNTGTYQGAYSLSTQDSTTYTVVFNTDGSKMYVLGDTGNRVYQYNLTTPWSVLSGVTYSGISFSIASQSVDPRDIQFSTNGTKMYMIATTGVIYQYSTYDPADFSLTWPTGTRWAGGSAPSLNTGYTGQYQLINFGDSKWIGSPLSQNLRGF